MNIHKRILTTAATLLSLLVLAGGLFACSYLPHDPIEQTGFYFDTIISVTIYDSTDKSILAGCMDLAERYENMLSAQREGTDVWRVNEKAGSPVKVDRETITLLKRALYYAELSGGKFDPSIGAVSHLWNFSKDPLGPVPAKSDINQALPLVDYTKIRIDEAASTITLEKKGMRIDLGAIAKGYIADRMKDYLVKRKVKSAVINLGGNVLVVGHKPDGSDFKVGIQKPFSDTGTPILVVSVTGKSVVTSGSYERYFKEDGVLYHHILDPATGYSVKNNLYSVSILSNASVDGDGLSTTCFVLGLDKGMELIESLPDVEAVFITDDMKLHYSSGFPK